MKLSGMALKTLDSALFSSLVGRSLCRRGVPAVACALLSLLTCSLTIRPVLFSQAGAQQPTPEASETLVLQGVTFPVGAAAIPHAATPVLETAVKLLKEHPQVRVRIEGHTDAPGNSATTQRLSAQRAVAVKEFLVRRGIDAARLETVGYGEQQPVTGTHTPADRALNSRVELKLIEEEPAP